MSDKPRPVQIRSDGPADVRETADGVSISGAKQPVALHIESIRGIGIENITDVESHSINRVFNSVSHLIRFYGGGEVRIAYDLKGELLEFEAKNVDARIENGERIVLVRRPAAQGKGS
jgi:hypothetical protein